MPEARAGHAASLSQSSRPSQMEQPSTRLLEEPAPGDTPQQLKLLHTDDAAVVVRFPDTPAGQKTIDKRSLDYIMRSGLAGGLAGCAAKTVVAPLDRVKILYQTSNPQFAKYTGHWLGVFKALRDINQADGMRGLFRGHSATLLRIFPYAGIKFLAYEQIRNIVIPNKSKETSGRRFMAGSLAGISSVFCTYPLEVIRVRMAFETKRDSRSTFTRICRQIYHETPPEPHLLASSNGGPVAAVTAAVSRATPRSGLSNFYRGFTPTLLGMVPYAGMSFLTHDTIGDFMRRPSLAPYTVMKDKGSQELLNNPDPEKKKEYRRIQLTAPAELTSGAISGFVSQTASYPLEVIRRRMQVGGAVGDGHKLGIGETTRRIFFERGIRGFFVGLTIGYIKTVPMVATSFYAYERGKWFFGI